MSAHRPIPISRIDGGLVADASRVTPGEFLAVAMDRMIAPPSRLSERYAATWRYCDALGKCDDRPALRAAYEAELAEIDAKYRAGLPLIDNLGVKGCGL